MTPLNVSLKITPFLMSFLVKKHSLALDVILTWDDFSHDAPMSFLMISNSVATFNVLSLILESERRDVFKWMSQIPYTTHHKTMGKGILPESGLWLLRRLEFIQWRKSSSSSILWLHGIRKFLSNAKGKHKITF